MTDTDQQRLEVYRMVILYLLQDKPGITLIPKEYFGLHGAIAHRITEEGIEIKLLEHSQTMQ